MQDRPGYDEAYRLMDEAYRKAYPGITASTTPRTLLDLAYPVIECAVRIDEQRRLEDRVSAGEWEVEVRKEQTDETVRRAVGALREWWAIPGTPPCDPADHIEHLHAEGKL